MTMKALQWMLLAVTVAALFWGAPVRAAEPAADSAAQPGGEPRAQAADHPAVSDAKAMALAASVAFVTAVSILGAAYAVGRIGSAALGAAAEKPELLLRSLPFVGLAEGLAVIGFIVAVILLNKF
jgi:V/A-type H+-transporting ATPase subunit K